MRGGFLISAHELRVVYGNSPANEGFYDLFSAIKLWEGYLLIYSRDKKIASLALSNDNTLTPLLSCFVFLVQLHFARMLYY